MKYPSNDYDSLVEGFRAKIRGNITSTTLTESECAQEVKEIMGGAFNEVEDRTVNEIQPIPPKRRGRPPGSRNRPKVKP